jgi:membrane associated rhomboid family serine protease
VEIDVRSFRQTPISAELVMFSIGVYLGCSFQAVSHRQSYSVSQRAWNAIIDREISEPLDGVRRAKELALRGPLDVWNGDWWRIPITVFHHQDLLSLILCSGAVWYLGSRLERRWGSLAMAMFAGPAICLPTMVELAFGNAYLGMSGLACAILGALVVLRNYDESLAHDFSEDAGQIGMAMILAGWLATLSNFLSLPNAAHFAGFIYGALMAGITNGPLRKAPFLRVSAILIHLWLVPLLFLVCHPFWIGRFHWLQAVATQNTNRAERSLANAIQCDGSLIGAWLQWSHVYEQRGDQPEAWRRLIDGLARNPAAAPIVDSTRRMWRHMDLQQRREAKLYLEQVFGRNANDWLAQIRNGPTNFAEPAAEISVTEEPAPDLSQFSLDRKIELPSLNNPAERLNPENRKIQNEQNEAVEGQTL